MLSVYQIERLFDAGRFDSLLRGVAPLGIDWPLPLEVRLSQQPAAVIALALKRVAELTYGPTALSRRMMQRLLAMLTCPAAANARAGGGGAAAESVADDIDPLAHACATAALRQLMRDRGHVIDDTTLAALDSAVFSLATAQAEDGLFDSPHDRTESDRALSAAFIFSLLGGDDLFRRSIRLADLMNWFQDHEDALDDAAAHLWQLGLAAGARPCATGVHAHRSLAAIAA